MAQQQIRRKTMTVKPAVITAAQSWSLALKKGERVVSASLQRTISAGGTTTSTWEARADAAAGGAAAGLIAATDTEGAVGSIVNGAGPDLASSGGFLATGDGLITVTYTPGASAGAVAPEARFTFGVVREYPY